MVAAIEAVEDMGHGFGRDSVAMVLYPHDGCICGSFGFDGESDFDGGGSGTVLEGVQEQVGEEQRAIFGRDGTCGAGDAASGAKAPAFISAVAARLKSRPVAEPSRKSSPVTKLSGIPVD